MWKRLARLLRRASKPEFTACDHGPCNPRPREVDGAIWSECWSCERYTGEERGFMLRTVKRDFLHRTTKR